MLLRGIIVTDAHLITVRASAASLGSECPPPDVVMFEKAIASYLVFSKLLHIIMPRKSFACMDLMVSRCMVSFLVHALLEFVC